MSARKGLWFGGASLLLLLFASVAVIFSARRDRAADETATAELQRKIAALRQMAASVSAMAATNVAGASPASAPTASAQTVSTTPMSVPGEAEKPAPKRAPTLKQIIASRPELLALHEHAKRLELGQIYGPLYRRLQLPAESVAQFEALLARDAEDEADLKTTAETLGLKSSDAALQQLRKDQKAALAAAQEKLLGPEGWDGYRQYQRVLGVRDEVTEIAGLAAFTDTPFSAKQNERLLFVVAEMSESYRNGGRADFFTVDWDAVLAQASGFLAEPQMDALRAHAQGRRMVHRLTQFYIKRGHKY